MIENEAMRKTLIVILTILLAVLVIFGLVMMNKTEKKDNEKEKNKTNTNTNNLCVEKLCISKVSIEEVENSKAVYIELQNTNEKTLENFCINIKTNKIEIPTCIESIEPNGTALYIYEYNDQYGKKLKDYSLEKVKE